MFFVAKPVSLSRFDRKKHKYALRAILKYKTGVSVYDIGVDTKTDFKRYVLNFSKPFSYLHTTDTKSKDYILLCFEYPPIGSGDMSFSLLLAKEDFKNNVLNWEYKSTEPLDEYRRYLNGQTELLRSPQ